METLIRSRVARVTLAILILGAGLWAFYPYVMHRVSSAAFVNAELMRVTSPIQGHLTTNLPHKGAFISETTTLPLVEAPAADRRQLAIYEQEHAVATARVSLSEAQLEELERKDYELGERFDRYRGAILERLAREREEANANLIACHARKDELKKQRQRVESLAKTGYVSTQRLDEIKSAHVSAMANCDASKARLERLKSASTAAKQGIFLQDGYNDTPYSQQQRDRLVLRKQELEAEILRERARITQLAMDMERERARLARASQYQFALPARHVVWTITASPGSQVVEGQAIMDLANCERRFVSVELPERDFESVKLGGYAAVRLLGSDTWMDGTVQQVLGSAARQDERLLAAQTPQPEGRRITVEIRLTADTVPTEGGRYCDIGRMAEVRLDRHRSSFLKTGPERQRPSQVGLATAGDRLDD